MGRRKQDPAVQAARGFPGRRKSQTAADLKAKAANPSPEDELLASLDIEGLKPPRRFLTDKGREALEIWKAVTPRLGKTSRASSEYGPLLTAYCDSVVRYNRAVLSLETDGLTVKVKTVSGDEMMRINPAEKIRQQALAEVVALSERFGFSPRDNFALLIDQRKVIEHGGRTGDLFGGQAQRPADQAQAPAPVASAIGGMDAFDSAPPDRLQ